MCGEQAVRRAVIFNECRIYNALFGGLFDGLVKQKNRFTARLLLIWEQTAQELNTGLYF
jgi:hypothetical protein